MDVFESDDDATQRPGDASTPRGGSGRRETPDAETPRRTSTQQGVRTGNQDQERDTEEREASAGVEATAEETEESEDEDEDDQDDEDDESRESP